MKRIFFMLTTVLGIFFLKTNAKTPTSDLVSENHTNKIVVRVDSLGKSIEYDTTIVRVGKRDFALVKFCDGRELMMSKNKLHRLEASENKLHRQGAGKFDGHWDGIEVGFNSFANADYSLYNGVEFMALNQGNSLEFDLNFGEVNVGLYKSYIGLVSGLGFSFNDYRFENPYTIARGTLMNQAVPLTYDDLSKSKLSVSYFRVPLLAEFQIPVNDHHGRLYINGGVIGGVRIGSHTKVKHGDTKDKDHRSFYMNSFKYEATARIGYKGIGLFANYSLNPLFRDGKGPELTPFTVGISFLDQ